MQHQLTQEIESVTRRFGGMDTPARLTGTKRRTFAQHALLLALWRRYESRFDIRQTARGWWAATYVDAAREIYVWCGDSLELCLLASASAIAEMESIEAPTADGQAIKAAVEPLEFDPLDIGNAPLGVVGGQGRGAKPVVNAAIFWGIATAAGVLVILGALAVGLFRWALG